MGVTLGNLTEYTSQFALPSNRSKVDKQWFAKQRLGEEQLRTPAASENVMIATILHCFLEDIIAPQGDLLDNFRCLNHCAKSLAH